MKYVTDTHSLVWYLTEDPRLSNKALSVEESDNFVIAPLDSDTLRIADKIEADLEMHDKLIAATALYYEAPLITKDENLILSEVITTVW